MMKEDSEELSRHERDWLGLTGFKKVNLTEHDKRFLDIMNSKRKFSKEDLPKEVFTDALQLDDSVFIYIPLVVSEYYPEFHSYKIQTAVDTRRHRIDEFYYPANCAPFQIPYPSLIYRLDEENIGPKKINNFWYTPVLPKDFETTGTIQWISYDSNSDNRIKKMFLSKATPVYDKNALKLANYNLKADIAPGAIRGKIERLGSLAVDGAKRPYYVKELVIQYLGDYSYAYSHSGVNYFASVYVESSSEGGDPGSFWCSPNILKRIYH